MSDKLKGKRRGHARLSVVVEATDEEGIPEGIELATLLIHDVTQVFVDLAWVEGVPIVLQRFARAVRHA